MWQQMSFVLKSAAGIPSGTFNVKHTHTHTHTHAHTHRHEEKFFGDISKGLWRFWCWLGDKLAVLRGGAAQRSPEKHQDGCLTTRCTEEENVSLKSELKHEDVLL